MAATVSAWAKPGTWALDSEEHEADQLQEQQRHHLESTNNNTQTSEFPSLATAAATKTNKKKKAQTLSLQEFTSYQQPSQGLTSLDLLNLPTGPRQRTAEELDRSKLGGGFGFRSYGSGSRDDSRWGSSSRGSDEQPRRQGGFGRDSSSREFTPSRADEVDDWGATKKSTVVGDGFERRERGGKAGFGFGFSSDSQSRADDSDNWVSNKSFVPSEGRRSGSGGGGAFDSIRERRASVGGFESNGSGADSDNWGRKKQDEGRRFGGGAFDSLSRDRERRGSYESAADSQNWGRKREEGTAIGTGSGRPKLNLQPRTLPVGEVQQDGSAKPKGSNPFGDARPREEVLKDKGHDWKEIDEKLEPTKMKEIVSAEGTSFSKRGFGSSNGRASLPDDLSMGNWRKSETVDAQSPRLEKIADVPIKESEDGSSEV